MIKMGLMNLLEKAMSGSTERHNVISNNISNVNTPGFKRSDVDFRSALDEAINPQLEMKTTNSLHLTNSRDVAQSFVIQDQQTSLRTDDNNVDIDMELATLAENNLYFNSLAHFLSSQLSLLKQSIS